MMNSFLPSSWLRAFQRIDLVLLAVLSLLIFLGLITLYSAVDTDMSMVYRQGINFMMGLITLLVFSQIQSKTLKQFAIWLYGVGIILLILVLL